MDHKALLLSLFDAAVKAADPGHCLPRHVPPPPTGGGRTIVVGAGKAAASMARALEQHWPAHGAERCPADQPKEQIGAPPGDMHGDMHGALEGLVVTRYGHGLPSGRIEIIEAAHPVPDAKGRDAARRILDAVTGLTPDDLVLCLISGGGSALLTQPAAGISLEDKQALNRALLRSGANITEMNTVRKHLSAIKGGRLAVRAHPARVVTLAISDVPGDDPGVIASGPTVADATTVSDAIAVLDRYAIEPPATIRDHLASGAAETPKPGDPRLMTAEFRMIATPMASLEAAADICRSAGITPHILGDDLEGEARDLAREHAASALKTAAALKPGDAAVALISGGETTVTVKGSGRGGRNAEYLLALTLALEGHAGISAIACDTDGIDGSEDNAGATTGPCSLARAAASGIDAAAALANNDGYTFFEKLGDLVMTGPTLTNINDFRAVIIAPPPP